MSPLLSALREYTVGNNGVLWCSSSSITSTTHISSQSNRGFALSACHLMRGHQNGHEKQLKPGRGLGTGEEDECETGLRWDECVECLMPKAANWYFITLCSVYCYIHTPSPPMNKYHKYLWLCVSRGKLNV